MSDNTDPFTNGPNQAKFGDPDVSSSDSPDDWKGWDWHQLEAAILGGSGMTTQSETQTAAGIADPSSLQNAADVFYNVQQTLHAVADDLVHQASLLAGQDDSPWQGQAANSFLAMVKSFANDIYANVSVLQDAAGNSVPDELINNANMLQWAQNEVNYIDSYYANLAAKEGANTVDGAVQVHEVHSIPPLMTSDMMQVMTGLAGNYQNNTYNTAVAPQAVNPNGNSNNGNVPNSNINGPNYGAPNYPNPNYPNINIPNVNIPNFAYPNPNIPNYGNLGGDPNLGNGGPNLTGGPNTDLNGNPNLGGSPNADLNGSPNLTGGPNANTPQDAYLPGAGGPGLNSDPNAGADSPVSGNPNLSAAPNAGDGPGASSDPALTGSPDLSAAPNAGDGPGTSTDPGLAGSPNLSAAPNAVGDDPAGSSDPALTGSPDVGAAPNAVGDNPAGSSDPGLTGSPDLSAAPNAVGDDPAGSSDPALTGSPDVGAAPNAVGDDPVGSSDPGLSDSPNLKSDLVNGTPDYSALNPAMDNALNPSSAATSPNLTSSDPAGLNENAGLPGTEDLATPSGASSPLDDGSGVPDEGGMPYMPGAGSGMGSPPLGSEPSDASGLLGKTTPFSSDSPLTGDEVGSPSGAAPGVGVGGEPLAVGGESLGESPALDDGMPYMPGMGSGAGPQALGGEPSDASGLLGRESEPWSEAGSEPLVGDEVGSPSGAAPGVGVGGEPLAVGGESLGESPALDDGMPYMPGMGSGAGPQALGGEPSDASGLLGRESEPWSEAGALPAGDEVGSADGAEAANAAEEEMPFMPGMGGGAQAAASGTDEHSDASGLLAEGDEFWTEGAEEHSPEVGLDNAAVAVGAAQAAWLGAGEVLAEPGLGEDKAEAAGYEAAGYEEFFEPGDGEGEFAEFAEPDGDGDGDEEHGQDNGAERVPVVGTDGSDDDLSGWDLAGAAADAALFTLGAWATRRRGRDDEDETSARIVSSEQEAWLGEDIALPDYDEDADALPGAATWRPNRERGSLTESARISNGMLRSAPPPKNYDPVAAAAAAAEAHEAERTAVQQAEVDEKWQRSTADLLTQDRDMWGGSREDWDAL